MLALRTRHRLGLLPEHHVQRGHPAGVHPPQQALPRGRHPADQRRDEPLERRARGTFPLRSLPIPCSLRNGGSFGPSPADRVFWRTRFSGPPGSRRYSVLKFNRDRDIPRWLRGLDLNQRPLGYEPFSNRGWSQGATNNTLSIGAFRAVAFGMLWLSLEATVWVKSGCSRGGPIAGLLRRRSAAPAAVARRDTGRPHYGHRPRPRAGRCYPLAHVAPARGFVRCSD